jgi:hypothetical protein
VEKLYNAKEASQMLSISINTLANSRCTGVGVQIPYIKVGGLVRYKESDLESYIDRRTFNHTGEQKEWVWK